MNYGQVSRIFEALLNRSDNTSAPDYDLFLDQGIRRITRQLRSAMNEKVKSLHSATTASVTLPPLTS